MLKFVVLCAVVAVASAKPNGLIGGWGSPLVGSSIVGSPVVSAYSGLSSWGASPLVASSLGVAPVVSSYSSPIVSGLAAPVVSSYSSSVVSGLAGPVVSSIAAPALIAGSEPALAPGVPAVVTKANGKLVDTLDVVVNRNNHLVAKNLAYHGIQKRSVGLAAPLAASWAGPVATPLAASWASPIASSWAAPVASTWGSPVVSSWGVGSPLAARTIVSPIGVRAW